ncbi:MAG: hypothetical protein LQ340_006932, partial [Diploschistes diacapsis]
MSSQPLRRNGVPKSTSPTSLSSAPKQRSTPAAASSPQQTRATSYLLTLPNLALAALYPCILALGSLTSELSPSTRSTPYSSTTQSHPPHLAPSYFARKSNVFNLYFVKLAWAWYSGAFLLFLLAHPRTGPPLQRGFMLTRQRLQALARYAVATAWWCGVTQWFFGPPLIDRGFRLSGGRCEMVDAEGADAAGVRGGEVPKLVTAVACKMAGGVWKGGYD